MVALDRTAWEVLNATADDCENLENIYHQVCCELIAGEPANCFRPIKGAPSLGELGNRVKALIDEGLFCIVMDEEGRPWQDKDDLSYVWRGWFSMTPRGRSVWQSSANLVGQD